LRRASETAGYLAAKFNLPVHTDTRLREIHQGAWQGLKISEIQSNYRSRFQSREKSPLQVSPPGGETVLQVGERLISFLEDIIPTHPQETVAVASHGFVMALLHILLNHEPFENLWQAIPQSGAWLEYQVSAGDLTEISPPPGNLPYRNPPSSSRTFVCELYPDPSSLCAAPHVSVLKISLSSYADRSYFRAHSSLLIV
jgi:broad specificity phosphatase PhoE